LESEKRGINGLIDHLRFATVMVAARNPVSGTPDVFIQMSMLILVITLASVIENMCT
jgi:hypothetical protein